MGMVEYRPSLKRDRTRTITPWNSILSLGDVQLSGKHDLHDSYKPKRALAPDDFEFLKLIGRGTFGRVFQVRKKDNDKVYAAKVVSKKKIIACKEVAHTIAERKILQQSQTSPFLVGLKFSFQTDTELFLVTDFMNGGELFWHLQKEAKFSEEKARFYVAELVLALEHLHKSGIVYRDLKPENILLDSSGHIALCDFGLSKPGLSEGQLTNTFCGTTEYLAPEMLLGEGGHSKPVDFWSLGVLLFEMCSGWSPFYSEDTQKMYENICFAKIKFPKNVFSADAKQFVKGLLIRNPKQRLGAQRDTEELKEQPFFKSIDWKSLAAKRIPPPFVPSTESDESTENFGPQFTSVSLSDGAKDGSDGSSPNDVAVKNRADAPKRPTLCTEISAAERLCATVGGQRSRLLSEPASTPLNESIQELFRGFSFSGDAPVARPTWESEEAEELDAYSVDEGCSSSSENDFNDDRQN